MRIKIGEGLVETDLFKSGNVLLKLILWGLKIWKWSGFICGLKSVNGLVDPDEIQA